MVRWFIESRHVRGCGLLRVGLAALALAGPGVAQSVKLNGPLARPIGGDIRDFAVTPGGEHALYLADQDEFDTVELFVVDVAAGAVPRKLNGPLQGHQVLGFELSPDGSRVVYLAFQDSADTAELYSVPIEGGAPVKLSGAPPAGFLPDSVFIHGYRIAPDGLHVVYIADQDIAEVYELYRVPIDGSGPSVRLAPSVHIRDFDFDVRAGPRGIRVVYRADPDHNGTVELFSVPLDLSASAVRLHQSLLAGRSVQRDFQVSADGAHVVFRADIDVDEMFELFSGKIEGGDAFKLNAPLAPDRDVQAHDIDNPAFLVSPGGERVVYRADQDRDDVFELYSTAIEGSDTPVKLNTSLRARRTVTRFAISPDGAHVLYQADQHVNDLFELFTVPIAGGASPAQFIDEEFRAGWIQFSPDSRVVYVGNDVVQGRSALFSAPVDASAAPVRLIPPLPSGRHILRFRVADASAIVYLADRRTDDVFELFTASLDGTSRSIRISGPLAPDGDVLDYEVGSPWVAYLAEQRANQVVELFAAPVLGGSVAFQLNGALPTGPVEGDVRSFALGTSGRRAAYVADQEIDDMDELYVVSAMGGAEPVKLNGALTGGGKVSDFRISPDDARVVYRADQDLNDVVELYSVPFDASESPIKLNPPLVVGGDVGESGETDPFAMSLDGERVVYRADQELDGEFQLYAVPVAGRTRPVRLSGPLVAGGDVIADSFRISDTSDRVVYRADQDSDEVVELYSASIDAGSPVKVSGALGVGWDVVSFQLVPGGSRVVYRAVHRPVLQEEAAELFGAPIAGGVAVKLSEAFAGSSFLVSLDGTRVVFTDQDQQGVIGLYSALVDGSSAAVELSEDGAVTNVFRISPDGSRVVYVADPENDWILEIYSVPIDGSSPPLRLDGPFSYDQVALLADLAFSPDGKTVVYRAVKDVYHVELYSVPVDGGEAPSEIALPFTRGTDVLDFGITPAGGSVVYRVDHDDPDDVFPMVELFIAPIGGGGSAARINSRPVTGGDVFDYLVAPGGDRVLYRATQEAFGVTELFSSTLPPPRTPAREFVGERF